MTKAEKLIKLIEEFPPSDNKSDDYTTPQDDFVSGEKSNDDTELEKFRKKKRNMYVKKFTNVSGNDKDTAPSGYKPYYWDVNARTLYGGEF